jgi:hypothetical protein
MRHAREESRQGAIAVFALIMMISMLAFVAFAVDMGYILVARTELQRSADAAAVAAAWQLIDEGGWSSSPETRETAERYVTLNPVGHATTTLRSEDVEIGHMANPTDPDDQIVYGDPSRFNAVRIVTQRSDAQNGELPLLFARVLGIDTTAVFGNATAAFYMNIRGFQTPNVPGHENLGILPFALDEDTWDDLTQGTVLDDDWKWVKDEDGGGEVLPGKDLEFEVNLFPQGTGSPGNRGTVDIGSSNNSTADLARQIVEGISPEDLAFHGGKLEFDSDGELELNGDTGISAGVKDELASIIGEIRMIPIFSEVVGPGNNAQYTIVKWVGVRIMEVKLTGPMNKKRVIIQPAKMITYGAIPADPGEQTLSNLVYSPPMLVR